MSKLKLSNKKKITQKYDPLLYGRDMEEGIVAVEPIPDEPQVEVFTRKNGRLHSRIEHSKSFFYTTDSEPLLDDLWNDGTEIWELEGDLHFNRMVETNSIRASWWFKKNAKEGNYWAVRERGQYLVSSGKTLFKGMRFDDPVRMYFDLETYTSKGYKFTNPERPSDKILIVAIKTNIGHRICLVLNEDGWASPYHRSQIMMKESQSNQAPAEYVFLDSEEELIQAFIYLVDEIDPDVFVNHNIYNFDFWFLYQRCRLLDIQLRLGRGGALPNTYDTVVAIGDKKREIKNIEFYGRHVIDTDIVARQVDVVKRKFENYKLKNLIREIGEEKEGRIIVPGPRIADTWDNKDPDFNRADLIAYAMGDVDDAQTIDRTFGKGVFYATQFTPYPYQDVMRLATGGKSNTLFVRHYYDHAHSLPRPPKRQKFGGGYNFRDLYGVIYAPINLADVKSLYPSIGIEENIQPKNDVLGYYQKVLRLFRGLRYSFKDQIKESEDPHYIEELKAIDTSIKPYLNTIAYGYLTTPFSLFGDYSEGARITEIGQKKLKKMYSFLQDNGATIIRGDTDGIHYIVPEKYQGSQQSEMEFIHMISDHMDEGIEIGMDGRYESMLVVDGKSYATKDYEGNYTIKGDTLKSRRKTHLVLDHLDTCVKGILDGDLSIMEQSFHFWNEKLKSGQVLQYDVVKYAELKEPLETYRTKVELGAGNGGRNADAAYEIACQKEENGIDIKVGDRIEYFVAKSPITVVIDGRTNKPRFTDKFSRVCDLAKDIDEFNPADINIAYYIERLQKSSVPLFMLFYTKEALKELFDITLYKKRRDKMEEISDMIYNDFIQ